MFQYNPNFAKNPLFHLGMGLLSVPSQSTNPADVSWGRGLQQGLLSFQNQIQSAKGDDLERLKLEMAREKLDALRDEQQSKLEAARARAEALPGLLSQLPEDKRAVASSLLAADPKAGMDYVTGLLNPEVDLPTSVEEYQFAVGQGYEGSYRDYQREMANLKAPRTSITNVMGGGYKTDLGKTANDLAIAEAAAARGDKNAADLADKLRQKLSTETQESAEESRAHGKYQLAYSAAEDFVKTAEQFEDITGPISGRMTDLKGAVGFASEEAAYLRALERQAKTQLGTALSGAAIPKTEWPNYEAQLPTLTDSPTARRGKLKAFKKMMTELEAMAQKRKGIKPQYSDLQPGDEVIQ